MNRLGKAIAWGLVLFTYAMTSHNTRSLLKRWERRGVKPGAPLRVRFERGRETWSTDPEKALVMAWEAIRRDDPAEAITILHALTRFHRAQY